MSRSWNHSLCLGGEGREGDGADPTQGGTAPALPAARGYWVRCRPWGTWAPSQVSGNCTPGAGGLGGPAGGPATVRGALPTPPWDRTKNCVRDTAWGFASLGSDHPFGNRGAAGPGQPRCLPSEGALPDSPANGLALVLEGAGTIVLGTMSPGSLQSLGRWGSPEEALPARPSVFLKAVLGSPHNPH